MAEGVISPELARELVRRQRAASEGPMLDGVPVSDLFVSPAAEGPGLTGVPVRDLFVSPPVRDPAAEGPGLTGMPVDDLFRRPGPSAPAEGPMLDGMPAGDLFRRAPQETVRLEASPRVSYWDLALEAAKSGALGGAVGGGAARGGQAYGYEPPLREPLRFPHITSPPDAWTPEDEVLSRELFELGQEPVLRNYRLEAMDPVVVRKHLTPRALAGIPEAELAGYLDGGDLSELTERRIRPHTVEVHEMPMMRTVLEDNPMMGYSVGGQSGIARAQDVSDAVESANLRGMFAHGLDDTGPAAAEESVLKRLAWDRAKSGEFSPMARAARGLKSIVNPASILADAALGSLAGAASAAAGYRSAAPRSAGLFTPPGPGYEGVVSPEMIERIAAQKELENEVERRRLIEQYNALGYELDPNTRLRDLR